MQLLNLKFDLFTCWYWRINNADYSAKTRLTDSLIECCIRRHRNNLKGGVSKLRFPHAKKFLRKSSAIWARALKTVRHPCSSPKKTCRISTLRGANLLTCPGRHPPPPMSRSGRAIAHPVSEIIAW
jgi:hypothetical protein